MCSAAEPAVTDKLPSVQAGHDRYRELVEHSGEMISTHRPGDWAYTSVNPAVTTMSGYAPEELLGRPALDFFHPVDAQAMRHKTIPAIRRHGVRTFRYRHRGKDGSYGWVESTHRSIRDPVSGALREIIAVTRDIGPQLEAERAQRQLAAVIEASADLVLFCNDSLRVNYMNRAALLAFGLARPPERLQLALLLEPQTYAELARGPIGAARSGGEWRGNLPLEAPEFEGRYMVLQEVQAVRDPLQLGQQKPLEYSLIVRDLSERKRAEQEALRFQAEMAHAGRLLAVGEMASGLAHELNQPLATALNYARGALRQIDSGQLREPAALRPALQAVARQAERAAAIIKRLRSLVARRPYRRERVELALVAEEVGALLRHSLELEGVVLRCAVEAGVWVHADRVQVEQALINLVQNAAEAYRRQGLTWGVITVEGGLVDAVAQLDVSDQAGGVDPALQARICEPYISSKADGIGMGLAIVRSIAEVHGGALEIDSDGRSYSRFSLRLPGGERG